MTLECKLQLRTFQKLIYPQKTCPCSFNQLVKHLVSSSFLVAVRIPILRWVHTTDFLSFSHLHGFLHCKDQVITG